jgi:LPXTG-site transpeptidase (sortase) family protein
MKKRLIIAAILVFILGGHVFNITSLGSAEQQLVTITETPVAEAKESVIPFRLTIPGIKLDSAISPMGLNDKGELDVPDGSTKDVGWYAGGTVPGQNGSAVLDAHVFAAFGKLKNLKPGANIYVTAKNGTKLHFQVYAAKTYKNADVPLNVLFNKADGKYLNLITCAGKLTADHSTYDHRLVVYAKLIQG